MLGIVYFVDYSITAYPDAVSYFGTPNFSDAMVARFAS